MAKKPANGATKPESIREREKAAMEKAVEKGEAAGIIKAAKLDADKLIGDLADQFIAEEKAAKHRPDWEKLDEEDQQERLDAAKHRATTLVTGVVAAIFARGGVAAVEADISKVDFVPGEQTAKVNCVIVQTPETLEHFAKGMKRCKILFADVEQFDGPMVTKAEPNEPPLIDHDEETGEIKDPARPAATADADA